MNELWIAVAVMTALTLGIILLPLLKKSVNEKLTGKTTNYDLVVYNDQLAEVERDLERGTISETDAEAARTEIKRRILTSVDTPDSAAKDTKSQAVLVAVILFFTVPLGAIAMYYTLGQPNMPDFAYADRDIEAETKALAERQRQQQSLETSIAKLKKYLNENPGDIRRWVLLGQTFSAMGRFNEAIEVYTKARKVAPKNNLIDLNYAESLVLAKGGQIDAEPLAIMKEIIVNEPDNARARYYVALAKLQSNDAKGALQDWVNLRALATDGAPWLELVNEQISKTAADLKVDPGSVKPSREILKLAEDVKARQPQPETAANAPGPTAEQVQEAGNMSADDRMAFIRQMVGRLAERLKDNPDDLEGWKRLAKAYEVLGETELARKANEKIKALSQ